MGCTNSTPQSTKNDPQLNVHAVNAEIKVHTVVSAEMDFDHASAMRLPLGEVTDEQLLAEVARRKLDLHDKITDAMVKETYNLGKVLGYGASGEVLLALHKQENKPYACKVVRKDASMNDAQSMSTEIEIMKRIRHRHVVSMYELYETPKCLWIILEFIDGGDMFSHLATTDHYSEAMAARHMNQILKGVHYLHSLGVVHRDLKLENILLAGSGPTAEAKIADFGLSALVRLGEGYDPEESGKRKRYRGLKEMWGTKEFFAPEVIDQAYGPQADVWALGCILFEMLSGHQAFPIRKDDNEESFYGRIKRGDFDMSRPVWKRISSEARDMVQSMLKVDPTKRLSATEAMQHPWIRACTSAHIADQFKAALTEAHEEMKRKYIEKKRREMEKEKKKSST